MKTNKKGLSLIPIAIIVTIAIFTTVKIMNEIKVTEINGIVQTGNDRLNLLANKINDDILKTRKECKKNRKRDNIAKVKVLKDRIENVFSYDLAFYVTADVANRTEKKLNTELENTRKYCVSNHTN